MHSKVIVAGAGPVGLLLANLLGREGIETLVLERRTEWSSASRALGITPTSMAIFARLGLAERFIGEGTAVRAASLYSGGRRMAGVSLARFPGPFPFILSIPQYRTEQILQEAAATLPAVRMCSGVEVRTLEHRGAGVKVGSVRLETGRALSHSGRLLCACDGASSTVRELAGVRQRRLDYPLTFLMADHRDRTQLGEEAVLFFTRQGSVESFPVPGGTRRWIVQVDGLPQDIFAAAERAVRLRTGIELRPADRVWQSSFQPARSDSLSYARGPVLLCGDAAHTMPPIGGQGMNTGFADAQLLALAVQGLLRGGDRDLLPRLYERYRRRAYSASAGRSALLMRLGTLRSPVGALLRGLAFRVLSLPPLLGMTVRHFTMLNVPYSTTDRVLRREPALRAIAGELPSEALSGAAGDGHKAG